MAKKPDQDWLNRFFNVDKYEKTTIGRKKAPSSLIDASDAYANHRGMVLSFQHVPTGKEVYFKAFIDAFNESFNSNWARETVYGRTDPIMIFRGNERKISLSFKIPAATMSEAYENLGKVQSLSQFLYPVYESVNQTRQEQGGNKPAVYAQTISQSPLVRLKVMNLLRSNSQYQGDPENLVQSEVSNQDLIDDYKSWDFAPLGLLGVINSMQIDHNLANGDVSLLEKGRNTLLSTLITVTIDFSPIHEHAVGWQSDGEPINELFPYGVVLRKGDTSKMEGRSFNERKEFLKNTLEDREMVQQALDNAVARYSGMGGEMRFKKDKKKINKLIKKGKQAEAEALALQTSAYAAAVNDSNGMMDVYDID